MVHVFELEWPSELEWMATGGFDIAEDFKTLFVPACFPGDDSGEEDDQETVREVGDSWIAWLEVFLELSVLR